MPVSDSGTQHRITPRHSVSLPLSVSPWRAQRMTLWTAGRPLVRDLWDRLPEGAQFAAWMALLASLVLIGAWVGEPALIDP